VPGISPFLIKPHSFHITLFVMSLNTKEGVRAAQESLQMSQEDCMDRFYNEVSVPKFQVGGLDSFGGHRVVYAGLQHNEGGLDILSQFARSTHSVFTKNTSGFHVEDRFKFTPHITLLKFRHNHHHVRQIQKRLKEVFQEVQSEFSVLPIGEQIFECVDLLSMKQKDADGYYKCSAKLYFKHHVPQIANPESKRNTDNKGTTMSTSTACFDRFVVLE